MPSDLVISQDLCGGKGAKWYGSGSKKGDKQENAGKRSPKCVCKEGLPSWMLLPSFPATLGHPAPLSPDAATASTPASSSQAGATNAEASCARSQGADYHGQTIHPPNSTTTTTTLLPPNRPSVAVYPAPLLCRLLEIHCHNPATSSTSINTPPTLQNTANMSDKTAAPTPSNPLPASTQPQAQAQNAPSGSPAAQAVAAQQSDNVAHALAGAGGGLLSMALTWVPAVKTARIGHHAEAITVTL